MDNKMGNTIKTRRVIYILVFILLVVAYPVLSGLDWTGSKEIHTLMEVAATLLAFFVGALAIMRYYSKKTNTFLFIGTGFIGTALLDGYHAVVTSKFFDQLFPSVPASLIPWSWNASRTFLAVLMLISWLAWKREEKYGAKGKASDAQVYSIVGILTLISFIIFAFVPLPRAYYPEFFLGRPEEWISAILFLIALVGYYKKGWWKTEKFEHWIVISLIVGFMTQALYMPLSYGLFDIQFDMAHTLKKVSYLIVLVGLFKSIYGLFIDAEIQIKARKEKEDEEIAKQEEELMMQMMMRDKS